MLQGSADLQGYGNGLANTIYGNTGNNLLDGGAGADTMTGGAGNDTYFVDNAGDAVIENADEGNDAVFRRRSTSGCRRTWKRWCCKAAPTCRATATRPANTLYGNTGNNLLNGGAGADTMIGGAGNDTYFVDNVGDTVIENANEGTDAVFSMVNYTLTANVETLVLQGAGNLSGTGNALANTIYGNSGNNTLNGQGGADMLTGNAGNDTFVFNVGQANGDTVVDFAGKARRRAIRSSSSATARARPSPTSTRRIGRSTTTAAPRTTSSRSATPRRSMRATSCSCENEPHARLFRGNSDGGR